MSPPIYTPDGSEVSEIVLPNGATASEVIDPDGNVVFEAGPDIPDSGISRFTFNNADTSSGTALDIWGNNVGSINGATTGVSGANQTYNTGEAYDFNGSGDWVNVGEVITDGLSEVSIAMWARRDGAGGDNPRIYGGAGANEDGVSVFHDEANGNGVTFFVSTKSTDAVLTTQRSPDGTWEHWVATYDGSTAELYVDGSLVKSGGGGSGNVANTETNQAIGTRGANDSSDYWNGPIDDVRIYSKALTSTEVSNLYNNGSI